MVQQTESLGGRGGEGQKTQVQALELTKLPSDLSVCSTVQAPKHTITDTQKVIINKKIPFVSFGWWPAYDPHIQEASTTTKGS